MPIFGPSHSMTHSHFQSTHTIHPKLVPQDGLPYLFYGYANCRI